jgi:DNA repair protein RadA/Sms
MCSDCGHVSPRWFGRCPACSAWSTATSSEAAGEAGPAVVSLAGSLEAAERFPTGTTEVDRVLGGGLVPGEVVLLAGEPGIGKSTLVLQLIDSLMGGGRATLLVTGEESLGQVAVRAERLGIDTGTVRAAAATSLEAILAAARHERPGVLVVDSIQTVADEELDQSAGSPTQVRESAARLLRFAKANSTALVLVGHVTKDGNVAGPKTLEHIVDCVLTLEGERTGSLRLLRAVKNRFGSCEETGVFVMSERGLEAVADPSAMLLADRCHGIAGSVVFPGLEGTRPVLMEAQALVAENKSPQPRRVAHGFDSKRLALLLGVLQQRGGRYLGDHDVFVGAAGGLAVREPAADLAFALAIASAHSDVAVPHDVVVFGEVGLGGEVRRVPGSERRLTEASRLGFTTAIVPRGIERVPHGMGVFETDHLSRAIAILFDEEQASDLHLSEPSEKARMVSLGSEAFE